MYRKNDATIFTIFSTLAYLLIFASLFLVLTYHFYEGRTVYRDLALMALAFSFFCQFEILLSKVYILEIRVSNLMNVGNRPGKLSVGMGNVAILIYSTVFWISAVGAAIAFLPAAVSLKEMF